MAARDDSVIRGSLITCLIFLVLSLALNFILWSWGSGQAGAQLKVKDSLTNAQNELRDAQTRNDQLMKMVGGDQMTQSEFDAFKEMNSGDANFDTVAQQFFTDMQVYGQDVGIQDRHYGKLTDYFTDIIRDRNAQYSTARDEASKIRIQAETDVNAARSAQQKAEQERENLAKQLDDERTQFAAARNDMVTQMEQAKDSKRKSEINYQTLQQKSAAAQKKLGDQIANLETTIDAQKLQINELRGAGSFERVQGEVRYVLRDGNIVSINLGSADALRRGVTFGVISRDDTSRLQDAKVKASIQVTRVLGPHLAEARVIGLPEISSPIIEGDAVYSPFWAPGRTVKIALAGPIDLDGDSKPDNAQLEGMVRAAGAEIADNGQQSGRIDPSVRFLVVGESPKLGDADDARSAAIIADIGRAKERANQAGVTVIPAWKLEAFLKSIDDTLTTPLGSAARAEDNQPRSATGVTRRRPTDLPSIFTDQQERVQRGNALGDILRPQ
ncbi:hypothetical protein LOC67_13995 [Stieleria sp. JC731]|uniref:hypothetical protein n=1 Tax=Pirellulaceae TaxID=2691357 RepID=UPI001E48141F|nr:hypothetical protein [Stieleria sp. JC731]MCC9601666.1 hypothetical protein [Stieleria sp. JC731]